MGIYVYDSGQHIFDRFLWALWMTAKAILKAIVFFPLWFAGYIITAKILNKEDSAFAWLGLILLFAFALYQVVFFVKGLIIGWKDKGNLLWVIVLIICIGFTCIFPAFIIFEYMEPLMHDLSYKNGSLLTWIFSIGAAIFIYSRYHFLTDLAPAAAYPAYQLGLSLTQ